MLGFGSVSSIFWTVKLLPLSDATVLSFLAPLFVALTAPLLLGEAPSK
jgi:drug/metabolite transporter (DMT)-like permease